MTSALNETRPKRRRTPRRLAAGAAAVLLLSGVSALAQTAPSYRIYPSHVVWNGDCVGGSTARGGPAYRIYESHVAWRNDEVATGGADVAKSQEWELFDSHVARYNACSLHPTVMSSPLPSYGWSDVENLLSGTAGPQG